MRIRIMTSANRQRSYCVCSTRIIRLKCVYYIFLYPFNIRLCFINVIDHFYVQICHGAGTCTENPSKNSNTMKYEEYLTKLDDNLEPTFNMLHFDKLYILMADHSGCWVWDMNYLRPLERWDREFESHLRHEWMYAFILYLCCPVFR
jgi:hypothetical protein